MKKISESVWGDVLDRGTGETIRKEDDINLLDVDGLYDYIKSKYEKRIFYLDKYTGKFNSWEICVDIIGNISLKTIYNEDGEMDHIVLSWSGVGVKIRHSFLWALSEKFNVENIGTCRRVIKEEDGTCTNKTYIDVIEFFLNNKDNMLVNESAWGGILDRGRGDDKRKEDKISENLLNALSAYIEIFAAIEYTHDYTVGSYSEFKAFIKDYKDKPRVSSIDYNMDDLLDYTKEHWDDTVLPAIEDAIDNLNKQIDDVVDSLNSQYVNESTWGGMLDRGSGDSVRKEDDLTVDDIKYDIRSFVERIVYYEQYKNILYDFERFCKERWNIIDNKAKEYVVRKVDFAKRCWGKVKKVIDEEINSENEKIKKIGFEKQPGKTIDDTLDTWWADSLDESDRMDVLYSRGCEDNYVNPSDMWGDLTWEEKMTEYVAWHPTNESVWKGILDRGSGEKIKKEDELSFEDMDNLEQFLVFYATRIVYDDYEFSLDGLCDYIESNDREGVVSQDANIEGILNYVRNYWADELSDRLSGYVEMEEAERQKNITNECEGVPGGATPASVGGMGAAYFPGPNGEPGSGDLPSPTGIVYHQVAPYTMFLKQIKKKKKKSKKFRKEDEPCVHSPNAKVYDYVDDFREYVDRTYNQMDRR